jgi:2-isopropylmalate synthase
MFVTEDTTRADPEALRQLYLTAVEHGAKRVCLCDTAGHATPEGTARLVHFVRELVGPGISIDWHGHNDLGLALVNALVAFEAGADRLHATALGIGERTGNTSMELLLTNLQRLGYIQRDLTWLLPYCRMVADRADERGQQRALPTRRVWPGSQRRDDPAHSGGGEAVRSCDD